MSKFYIHFQHGDRLAKDDEGQDFPGLEEAEAAAIMSAREILANEVRHASRFTLVAVLIANTDGIELARITAKDVLPGPLK